MAEDLFQKKKLTLQGSQAQALDMARVRLVWIVLILMMGYLAIGLRMGDLSLLRHKSGDVTADAANGVTANPSLRGDILDRNGNIMATTLKMASVYADTTMIDNPEVLAKKLSPILPEQSEADLLKKLSSGKEFIWLQRDITPKQEYAINALGNPALSFQEESRRIYPDAHLAAHVIGYTDTDGNGIAGVEKYFNKQLSAGDPVKLTIDMRIQHTMRKELAAAVEKFHAVDGVGMVMDVNTGEIISMVSLPDFDPNHVGDASNDEKFNRATLGVFEMGSTFKLFSIAAGLDSGKVHFSSIYDAADPIKIGRFTISDYHAKKRPLTIPEIFIYSSNIGTARMAESLGPDGIKDFYDKLGFMKQAPVEMPERGTPIYPSPWHDVNTLTASFGHGIAVSPLHLIRAASGLVNGGVMPVSTLVMPEKEDNLSLEPKGTRVVSLETSEKMRQLLELVVAAGTGTKAWVDGYDVGGKTGTAEKNIHGKYERDASLSSFIGVFPVRAPRYAVLAILDDPKGTKDTYGFSTGGWTAAPVVANVISQMGPLYQIQPDLDLNRMDVEKSMSAYLKEYEEGKTLASLGTDH